MRRTSFVVLLLLAACGNPEPSSRDRSAQDVRHGSALEQAALDSGVIADASKLAISGLYQRRHEAGRDSLCVMPGEKGRYRFALEAIFGTEQYCRGEGTARRVGDKLILNFSGRSHCLVITQYDGDRIAMPGVLDMKCTGLCSARGSLEGVNFPRLSSAQGAALAVRDKDGNPLCEGH